MTVHNEALRDHACLIVHGPAEAIPGIGRPQVMP